MARDPGLPTVTPSKAVPVVDAAGTIDAPESPARETWRRFTRHRVGVVALGVVLVLFALSFLGRFLLASDPSCRTATPPTGRRNGYG